MKKILVILFLSLSSSVFSHCDAQYTILHNFNGTDGQWADGTLTLSGSVLYGMTGGGGNNINSGVIFSIDTNGSGFNDMMDFNFSDGAVPHGALTISGNVMYGMTLSGGNNAYGYGCVFSIHTDGSGFNDILYFNGNNGYNPIASLTLSGNTLYGTTTVGGAHGINGNVFSVNTDGSGYKDLHDFNNTDGSRPSSDLTLSGNVLYGTTLLGGANGDGCIFSIHTDGSNYKDLLDFNVINGLEPFGAVTLSGNKLYGVCSGGGAHDSGCVFSVDTNGNSYKDLFDFHGTSGAYPYGNLTRIGKVLYGTTHIGGLYDSGCIYSIDTDGSGYKNLFNFNGTNGSSPGNGLTIIGNKLYGMTWGGGANHYGVIYSLKDTNGELGISNVTVPNTSINVYPNPSNGIFQLQIRNYKLGISNTIEVYNVLGEKVYSQFLISNSSFLINLSGQPNGIYLYRVITETGALLGEGKLVIQK